MQLQSSKTVPIPDSESPTLPAKRTRPLVIVMFVFVILAWGFTWVAMKVAVREVTPFWAIAMRTAMATVVLIPCALATGQLVRPTRNDWRIVLVVSLFHMSAFASMMTAGLTYVSAGRAIVLGYTTPLWVAPAAAFLLKERMHARKAIGIIIGLSGLFLLAGPGTTDWGNARAALGNGLPLLAAFFWAISIVYTRAHRWDATPFQLLSWQCLVATVVLIVVAFVVEGRPPMSIGSEAWLALAYNGVVGTVLGYWAIAIVSKALPATTVSLGLLATPVCGLVFAALTLGEHPDWILVTSALLITFGIALGTKAAAAR